MGDWKNEKIDSETKTDTNTRCHAFSGRLRQASWWNETHRTGRPQLSESCTERSWICTERSTACDATTPHPVQSLSDALRYCGKNVVKVTLAGSRQSLARGLSTEGSRVTFFLRDYIDWFCCGELDQKNMATTSLSQAVLAQTTYWLTKWKNLFENISHILDKLSRKWELTSGDCKACWRTLSSVSKRNFGSARS